MSNKESHKSGWACVKCHVDLPWPRKHLCAACEARARLNEAAPELLEALRWVRGNPEHAIGNDDHAEHCDGCQRALAAIAKAEGK